MGDVIDICVNALENIGRKSRAHPMLVLDESSDILPAMWEMSYEPRLTFVAFVPYPVCRAELLCEVPHELGSITRLRPIGNRVIAETESGIPMIVPVPR